MRGASVWSSVRIPIGAVADWSRAEVLAGLAELERVQREVSAAMTGLVIALGVERRDTATVVVRTAGALSAEHVRALGPAASTNGVLALLDGAGQRSPEELARQALALRLDADHGDSLSARQRARRCVRFFAADDAMVGVRTVLGPVEGAEVRSTLMRLTDEAWKRDHPQRADVFGGHGGDPYKARMADAFVVLLRGGTGPAGPGHRCRPAVIVTVTLDPHDGAARAEVIGQGPVPVVDAWRLAGDADLYGCVLGTKGEILRFGRNRRLASHTQRLAVIARHRHCQYQRCTNPTNGARSTTSPIRGPNGQLEINHA